jgi:hypothetical protein
MRGKHTNAAAARREQQAAAHELEFWQRKATQLDALMQPMGAGVKHRGRASFRPVSHG